MTLPPSGSRPLHGFPPLEKMAHEPTGAKPLWNHPGFQLPAYMQHLFNDLVEGGRPHDSSTYRMAVGIVENWARGGPHVKPDTQAKAAAAVAEWEKMRAQLAAERGVKKESFGWVDEQHPRGYHGHWILSNSDHRALKLHATGRLRRHLRATNKLDSSHQEAAISAARAGMHASSYGSLKYERYKALHDKLDTHAHYVDIKPQPVAASLAKARNDGGVMVALHPDMETAKRIAGKPPYPNSEPPSKLHVTLAYLGDAAKLQDPAKLQKVVAGWAAKTPPVSGQLQGFGVFNGEDSPVTYAPVDCPSLGDHRHHLAHALRQAGLPLAEEHDFTPHMTLSYEGGPPTEASSDAPLNFTHVTVSVAGRRTRHELGGVTKADRYTGLGYPDPDTVCTGQCEGLGFYPVQVPGANTGGLASASPAEDAATIRKAREDGRLVRIEDGWAWIDCEDCGGEGVRKSGWTSALHPRGVGAQGGQFIAAGGQGSTTQGQDVTAVQRLLKIKQSGKFDAHTTAMVRQYQRRHGLQQDGIVGAQTAGHLLGASARAPGRLQGRDASNLRYAAGVGKVHKDAMTASDDLGGAGQAPATIGQGTCPVCNGRLTLQGSCRSNPRHVRRKLPPARSRPLELPQPR